MTQTLHIALAQVNPIVGDIPYNLGKIRKTRDEAPDSTDLIVFPEMVVCGYPPEDLVLKPFFMDEVQRAVDALAKESKGKNAALIVPAPWKDGEEIYNALHFIHDGSILATRTKRHLPNYGVFDEQRRFKPGPLPEPVTFKDIKLGLMICEDMWYPDAANYLKQQGAEILIIPNASPFDSKKHDIRLHLAQARTDQTGLPLIYVNQIGGQDELIFDGGSFALDHAGTLTTRMDQFKESLDYIKLNRGEDGWRIEGTQNLPPPLQEQEAIYSALVLGLRDYIAKNDFPGLLIGLSGGIDSALSAAIAVDALGPDAVHCVMMPSQYTSKESLEDAKEQADTLGVKLDTIPIEETVEAFGSALKPLLDENTPATTFENIQSRTRGLLLMALSNASGKMVLSTGNKSEMAVGYATLYGDMCGGFNVLKDIYKTQVYEMARWRNQNNPEGTSGPDGMVIPERVITKNPTAELRDNQSDQDTLPPYDVLDDILTCLIEQDMDVDTISKRGHKRELVQNVWKMLDMAEYKRRQAPPGVKITSRAFGRDRRYPITNHFMNIIEKSAT